MSGKCLKNVRNNNIQIPDTVYYPENVPIRDRFQHSEFVQNVSRNCLEFVQDLFKSGICPEYFHVWNMSSFICPEFVQNFFMSRICLEKISGIFHVQNLSSLFVQILSRFFSCLEYVQNLSGFLDMKNSRQSFFRTFSRHFLDMKRNSGQFPDNFDDIFWIFLFYRVGFQPG